MVMKNTLQKITYSKDTTLTVGVDSRDSCISCQLSFMWLRSFCKADSSTAFGGIKYHSSDPQW